MNREVKRILADIKSLKIQGARAVAKAGVRALLLETQSFKGDREALLRDLGEVSEALIGVRPTEPLLRNYVRLILSEASKGADAEEVRDRVRKAVRSVERRMKEVIERIASYGSSLINDGGTYMTYCHSSTVMAVFKRAKDKGKDFTVITPETRPLFQGRISARELVGYGIPVTMIVDSAVKLYVKKADAVFVGGDAITASGNLINKIGTSALSLFAEKYDVPFYSCVGTFKFAHYTRWGQPQEIERRDPSEVWDKRLKGLRIENPAFDVTPSRRITAFITEVGLIPPSLIPLMGDLSGRKTSL